MWEFDTEFSEIIQRTAQIKSFRLLAQGQAVTYDPGQFFFITIKIDGNDAMHHFSFSSSPTESGYIEFTKRITDHEFSQELARIQPGAWAHIRGPSGTFVLPPQPRKLALLSGGIGITPLRSMLCYISDRKERWDIALLYGNSTVEDIVFRDELDSLGRGNPGIRIVHVLSSPPAGWQGKTGFINKEVVMDSVPDFKERMFYISGPPRMVAGLEEQLLSLNIPQSQLKRDSFTGYD